MLLTIAQPDHETTDQRIRARIVRMIHEKFSLRTQRRNSQPKFFKPYRGFAGVTAKTKELFITKTYAWRSKRYSNWRSGSARLPFEISAEFGVREAKMADRENFPRELSASMMHTLAVILRLHIDPSCWVDRTNRPVDSGSPKRGFVEQSDGIGQPNFQSHGPSEASREIDGGKLVAAHRPSSFEARFAG
jgi:hypothetical protein